MKRKCAIFTEQKSGQRLVYTLTIKSDTFHVLMQFLEHSLGHKSYSNFSRQGVIAIGCFQMDVAIPGYKTVKIIGKGGMAKVYLAIQESFDRQAALKIMSPHLTGDPIFGERFLREAKIIASLNHRNIVPVYEVGQHENFHYLSMEYLPGGDLKSRLIKGIRPDEALAVICETASALSYAHSKSYIHRDIKPENILFREDNTSVLTDFGIAKALDTHDANMTSTGMIVGSPHYMSPEQALGKKIDTRSDLYSLGVVLYEVLVGRPLYKADSSVAAAVKHISEPIPKLPDCYACLQEILEKMVAKKPEDRFQTAEEIVQALEPFLMVPAATWGSLHLRNGQYETEGGTKIFTAPSATQGSHPSGTFRRPTPIPITPPQNDTGFSNQTTAIETLSWQHRAKETLQRYRSQAQASPKKAAAIAALVLIPGLAILGTGLSNNPDNPVTAENNATEIIQKPKPVISNSHKLQALAKKALREERSGNLNKALGYYQEMLTLEPNNVDAHAGEQRIAGWHLENAFLAIEEKKNPQLAESALAQAKTIAPNHPNIAQLEKQLAKLNEEQQQQALQVQQLAEEISALLAQADTQYKNGNLIEPSGSSANDLYSRVLILDGDNQTAQAGLKSITDHYSAQVQQAIDGNNPLEAQQQLNNLARVDPEFSLIPVFERNIDALKEAEAALLAEQLANQEIKEKEEALLLASLSAPAMDAQSMSDVEPLPLVEAEPDAVSSQNEIQSLLEKGNEALKRDRLMFPKSTSAYRYYSSALELEPEQPDAMVGLRKITQKYLTLSSRALNKGELNKAEQFAERASQIISTHNLGPDLNNDVASMKTTIARVTYLEVMGELELWNDTLSNPNSVTVENLEKAYNAYMAVIAEDLKNAKVDTANDLYAEAFFQLGKKHFKNKDMEVSKALISKGLEIDPNHAQLKDLYARWQRRQTGNEGFFDRFY